ncbi:hypothetical protein EVAR_59764_1 [Eumeta japonica]|uniref:Uncharacterized protein n=1 Tax=Eumeta variegata TaxID=151549 RepID=A0A4C1ZKG2_EUMVA|nr:hypothetical protein EVAR_59764_1 [Eumeta japonica]
MGMTNTEYLPYPDGQVILASSAHDLQRPMSIMNESFEGKGMEVNAKQTKVMIFERDKRETIMTHMKMILTGGYEKVKLQMVLSPILSIARIYHKSTCGATQCCVGFNADVLNVGYGRTGTRAK